MHPEDIKAAIRKAQTSPAQIARALRITDMAVSHVIHGRCTSRRVARAISAATKLPISQLWPNKYKRTSFLEAWAANTDTSPTARAVRAGLAQGARA